jgi:hypothetical protein
MSIMDFLTFNINRILPETQRRMKITLLVLFLNLTIFTIGLFLKVNLLELGGGLTAVESPVLTWLIGESIRPTGYKSTEVETTTQVGDKKTKITTNE